MVIKMKNYNRHFLAIYLLLLSICIRFIFEGIIFFGYVSIILPIISVIIVITIFLDNLGNKDK